MKTIISIGLRVKVIQLLFMNKRNLFSNYT
jgi:hypothetical protein